MIDWHTAATAAAAAVVSASLLPKQFVVEFATDDDGVAVTVVDNDEEWWWWWRDVGKYMDEKFVAKTLLVLTKLFTLNEEELLLLFVDCKTDNDDVVGGKIPINFDDELCEPTDILLLLWLLWLLRLLAFDILELSSSSLSSSSLIWWKCAICQ